MNINNDSNLLASFMDEEEGAPELSDNNRSSVGPNAKQNNFKTEVPVTGVVTADVFNAHSPTMMPLSGQTRIISPVQLKPTVIQGQVVRTNISVSNTVINSPTNPPVLSASLVNICERSADVSSPVSSYCTSSNLVLSPTTHARKRLKLSDGDVVSINDDLTALKKRILEHKLLRMKSLRERYAENAAELFYLQAGGNMIDYQAWRKRPPTQQLLSFFRTNRLDVSDENEDLARVLGYSAPGPVVQQAVSSAVPQGAEIKIPGVGVTPVAVSTTLPAAVAQLSQQGGTPLIVDGSPASKPIPPAGFTITPPSSSTQEHIVEKAKQEAYVMQRISDLQKEGLWTEKRLPKVMEPPRTKAHWDYLLEEMVWLAADFAQERKWKKAAAKKCARMIQKHFQEKALAAQKAEKAQELQLRRIASFVAKEIKVFWSNVEKLVEFKQQTRLEEQRKQALDQQLSFIVDQTEKYSQQLAEGMRAKTQRSSGDKTSAKSSSTGSTGPSDDEFCPSGAISTDDEETIDAAEKEEDKNGVDSQRAEIEALQRESQMDLDQFLNELPENYLENRDKIKLSDSDSSIEASGGEDSEFQADGDSSDDEDTIMEQEKQEGENDHKQEIDELKAESEMSIEELMKKYTSKESQALSPPLTDDETSSSTAMEEDSDDDEETDNDKEMSDTEQGSLNVLMEETKTEDVEMKDAQDDHRMEDAAAIAESIQPTGNTLSSTQVVTKVPFLLRHCLREYQHIGLDWLVTMEQRRLNGILADEMGLGKTIQTISLLAHLACEKGDWGPHLIVVPTSVMLNWEMEFKKWCPAFKILTYYGTIKERKLKRIGWTKPNAFHICITSYKLVIQDHQSFRRKKWKYLILDEAQNIKNFKSQRWQLLLNFQTQQRLLLTGTPLQNNLMELWSLMHFLMPDVFASHREFKEWFSNPVSGMIEGNSEYNESIIKRLHKVLRPFLLRRLKSEVEKQMPKKYEHVIMCRLSKRQRFLYDDFMSRAKTKETLATGNLLSVINVLMQLRKVCNHPNLFEVRPIISPFQMCAIDYHVPSLVYNATNYDPFKHIDLSQLNLNLLLMERTTSAFCSHRVRHLSTPRRLIEELDSAPPIPPRCPTAELRMHITVRPCAPVLSTSVPVGDAPVGASPRVSGEARRGPIVQRARPVMRVAPLPPALVQPLTPRVLRQLTAARTATVSPLANEVTAEPIAPASADSEFVEASLENMLTQMRREKLQTLGRINERRCSAFPLYGTDLRAALAVAPPSLCSALAADINTIEMYASRLKDVFERYVVCIPAAASPGVQMRVGRGAGSRSAHERRLEASMLRRTRAVRRLLHVVQARMTTYFPDARLIQYDCGKLQTLDMLLRKLKSEQHRVLIFTQMTRMLDVLEAFLTFHGHIYLRLDGTTRVDQRQTLMERFNADSRIFAFILSTRSGGVGVNLTGADTVIFYDSDWNPTMDAQAQDRCHRIGQTRDVHIYRLISERTVEENILKKANQKRMLGDVAIEGGNFTTAYFKSSTIQDLFNVGTSTTELVRGTEEQDTAATAAALESALAQAEDEADVAAARCARAEAAADLAEFDETIPIEADRVDQTEHVSKAELELRALMDQLSPVERYAMRLVESSEAATSAEQAAVAEMARQRRDWEAARRALQREAPTPPRDDDDRDLTFSRRDAVNQIWISDNTEENMPMWCPPTPPQGEGDVYTDISLGYLYEWNTMTEAQLPPVYVRRENKRTRADTVHSPDGATRRHTAFKSHGRREDAVYAPRSLFERPTPALAKMRREMKLHKYRGSTRTPVAPPAQLAALAKPAPRPYLEPDTVPEWTVAEEMALLQAVKAQGLPLSLTTLSPAHTPNWDLAADAVNNTSRIYRSPRQCRNRYEAVVMPREEGKLLLDAAQKKPKKTKGPCKALAQQKGSRSMRTSQLYESDNNATFTQAILSKYDAMKSILNKKASTPKRRYDDPTMKNPKHAAVLAEYGVSYETPPTPMEVASRRADRIAKEKQKSATEQAAAANVTGNAPTRSVVGSQVAPSPPPTRGTVPTARIPEQQQQASTATTVAQQTARPQRIVVAAQQVSTVVAKGAATQAQAALYRQQALVRQQMKMLQAGVSVAGTVPTTIAVTTQQRTQIVSQASKAGVVARVPEGEFSALLKRQQTLGQQKVAQQALATHQTQQLQVATVSLASGTQGMKMATPQQLRQLQLQQQLALAQRKGQKVTQLTQVTGAAQVMVTGAVRPRMLPRAPHQLVLSHVSAALQPRANAPPTSTQPPPSTDAEQR